MTPEERRLRLEAEEERLRQYAASSSPESQDSEVCGTQLIEMKLEKLLKNPTSRERSRSCHKAGEFLGMHQRDLTTMH